MDLELEVDAVAGVLVVEARGAMVGGVLDPLRRCLMQAIDAGRPVVLDLREVEVLDTDGVGLLREAHARLATRLRVVLERGGAVHAALKAAGLAHTLALHGSAVSALSVR
jgi:anti-anti-sigma factor